MNGIKAIQTWYDGILYRSRSEARLAVFLDHAGIRFRYEHEGYVLPSGKRYLPDFILPDIDVFIENKGEYPNVDEISTAEQLANATFKAVFINYGGVGELPNESGNDSMLCVGPHGLIDSQYWFCECEYCGLMGIQFQGRSDRLACDCLAERGIHKAHGFATPKLIQAYAAAKSARFEFGDSGSMLRKAAI